MVSVWLRTRCRERRRGSYQGCSAQEWRVWRVAQLEGRGGCLRSLRHGQDRRSPLYLCAGAADVRESAQDGQRSVKAAVSPDDFLCWPTLRPCDCGGAGGGVRTEAAVGVRIQSDWRGAADCVERASEQTCAITGTDMAVHNKAKARCHCTTPCKSVFRRACNATHPARRY